MKKTAVFVAGILLSCMLLGGGTVTYAQSTDVNSNSKIKNSVDVNVDRSIFDQLKQLQHDHQIKDKDIPAFLEKAGWTVKSHNTVYLDRNGKEVSPFITPLLASDHDPSSYSLSIWETYNNQYPMQWTVYAQVNNNNDAYNYPASYDVLGIDWQSSVMDYRSYAADTSDIWLQDGSQRYNGTLLFSFRDLFVGYSASTWVGLSQVSWDSGVQSSADLKFTHTYDVQETSTSQTGSASYTWGSPISLGVSYTVNTSTVEQNWTKSSISSFYMN